MLPSLPNSVGARQRPIAFIQVVGRAQEFSWAAGPQSEVLHEPLACSRAHVTPFPGFPSPPRLRGTEHGHPTKIIAGFRPKCYRSRIGPTNRREMVRGWQRDRFPGALCNALRFFRRNHKACHHLTGRQRRRTRRPKSPSRPPAPGRGSGLGRCRAPGRGCRSPARRRSRRTGTWRRASRPR